MICYDMQEIWTLCRIFKRNVSQRKQQIAEVKQLATKRQMIHDKSSRMSSNVEFNINNQQTFINFGASHENHHNNNIEDKLMINTNYTNIDQRNHQLMSCQVSQQPQQNVTLSNSNLWIKQQVENELLMFDNWDELGSVVKFAVDSPSL